MFKNKINYKFVASMLFMGLLFNYTYAMPTASHFVHEEVTEDITVKKRLQSIFGKILCLVSIAIINPYELFRNILILVTRPKVIMHLVLISGILANSVLLYYNEESK